MPARRLSYINFRRALSAGSFGLLGSCVLFLALEYFPVSLYSRVADFQAILWALFVFSALALLAGVRWLVRFVGRWGAWTETISLDVVVFAALWAIVVALLDGRLTPPRATVIFILAFALVELLAARVIIALRPADEESQALPLFDHVLGPGGLAPLNDFEKDALGRATLLTALEELVGYPRQVSINFGVEGPWGSGKTTVLLELRRRLMLRSIKTIWLDAWSYREPARLLNAYFEELRETIGESLLAPNLAIQMRRLVGRLAPLAGHSIGEAITRLVTPGLELDLEAIRTDLKLLLNRSKSSIVVFLDDLDRVDGAELQTVLRAVRLVSDLPHLTHVLAYDRARLAKLLFPEDRADTLARDFLGKVINIELPLPPAPKHLAFDLLTKSLKPLLETLPQVAAEEFAKRLDDVSPTLLMEALPTPREITRVGAATSWIYSQMPRRLNAFDLFVLCAIQYRYPWLYDRIRSRPWEFAFAEWSSDLTISGPAVTERWLGKTEDVTKRRRETREGMQRSDDREAATALRLAEVIFPIQIHLSEGDARRGRRAFHPDILPRYYQLYVQPEGITEIEMEDFAEAVLREEPSEARQTVVAERLVSEAEKGRIHEFLSKWYLVFGGGFLETPPSELARDIALGLAKAAKSLPTDSEIFVQSARGRAAATAVVTVLPMEVNAATSTALEVVRASGNLPFALYFLAGLERGALERGLAKEFGPGISEAKSTLATRYAETFRPDPASLLAAPIGDRAMLVMHSPDLDVLRALVFSEIREHPESAIRLLELVLPGIHQEITDQNLQTLDTLVDLHRVDELTRHLDPKSLPDDRERTILREFREWVVRVRGASPSPKVPNRPAAID